MSPSEPLPAPELPINEENRGLSTKVVPTRPWVLGFFIAIAMALLAWIGGELGYFTAKPGMSTYKMMGATITGETSETRFLAEVRTSALTYGAFGALLGLGLGLTGGFSTGRLKSTAVAAILGLLIGGASGVIASSLVLPAYNRWSIDVRGEPLPSLAMHCGLWLPLAAAAGLAYGLGRGGWRYAGATLGGMAGGLLGTVIYEVLGALALPLDGTSDPVSATWLARLITFLCLALGCSVGAILASPRLTSRTRGSLLIEPTLQ